MPTTPGLESHRSYHIKRLIEYGPLGTFELSAEGEVTSGMELINNTRRGDPVRSLDRVVKLQVAVDAKG
jgi:hypothetical protein